MSAMVRLRSKNKVDNLYAYKYYFYVFLSLIAFAYSIFCFLGNHNFTGAVCLLFGMIMHNYKNLYKDFSSISKCQQPHTLEDFMHCINTDSDSRTKSFICHIEYYIFALLICSGFVLFLGSIMVTTLTYGIASKNGLPVPSLNTLFNNLLPLLLLFSFVLLTYLESKNWVEYDSSFERVSNELATSDLIQKLEYVKFPVDGQKENFAHKVSGIIERKGRITRKKLYETCSEYNLETDKESSLHFLKKFTKKDEK